MADFIASMLYRIHCYELAYKFAKRYCPPNYWLNFNDEPHSAYTEEN